MTTKTMVYGINDMDRVKFYIDGILRDTDTEYPYEWTWDKKSIGRHKIRVIAYDNVSNIASDEEKVMIFQHLIW